MARDPRSAGPRPPYLKQTQSPPGNTAALDPEPDHGDDSNVGGGRFADCGVIVTGGDSGIGRAIALAFAREGADVLICYLEEHDDAHESAEWVKRAGRRAALLAGDVSTEAHCEKIVATALKEFGRIECSSTTQAFNVLTRLPRSSPGDEIRKTFGVNIESMFYLSKAAAAHMTPGSAIVNTASIQADHPSPQLLAYAAPKGAITNFTAGLAQLLAKQGIRVNAVAPGPIWTPLIPSTMPTEKGFPIRR